VWAFESGDLDVARKAYGKLLVNDGLVYDISADRILGSRDRSEVEVSVVHHQTNRRPIGKHA